MINLTGIGNPKRQQKRSLIHAELRCCSRCPDGRYFDLPQDGKIAMRIPASLIPACSDDGSPVTMNLRADDSFVEDESWHGASRRYAAFLDRHRMGHILYLELGVGANTPVIIKYPFWAMTDANPEAVYACVNYAEAYCPGQIAERSTCIRSDIGEALQNIHAD